jgi:6-phosphogluconolactonase (cycloisomerase 2 family)
MRSSLYFGFLPALLDVSHGANIFVSHYSGTVSSLTLTETSGGGYNLATNKSVSIGGQPSWLTWDSGSRTLYVSDEGNSGTSVTAVSAAANGGMTQLGKSPATAGAVANCQYGGGAYLASVH